MMYTFCLNSFFLASLITSRLKRVLRVGSCFLFFLFFLFKRRIDRRETPSPLPPTRNCRALRESIPAMF